MEQARVAICRAFGIPFKESLDPAVPTGIYTLPEASMVGLTERDIADDNASACTRWLGVCPSPSGVDRPESRDHALAVRIDQRQSCRLGEARTRLTTDPRQDLPLPLGRGELAPGCLRARGLRRARRFREEVQVLGSRPEHPPAVLRPLPLATAHAATSALASRSSAAVAVANTSFRPADSRTKPLPAARSAGASNRQAGRSTRVPMSPAVVPARDFAPARRPRG
jgi:hypothetical protein